RPNVEAVLAAHPDLVVLYASDDNRDAARRLRAAGVPTAAFRVDRVADFERVTLALGALTGDSVAARTTVDSVRRTLDRVRCAPCARGACSASTPPSCSGQDRGSAKPRGRSPSCCTQARCSDVTPLRWTMLVGALLVVAVAGVMLGTMQLSPGEVLRALLGQ